LSEGKPVVLEVVGHQFTRTAMEMMAERGPWVKNSPTTIQGIDP